MPTFQLTDDRAVSIPAAPLAVRVHSAAGSQQQEVGVAVFRDDRMVEGDEVRRPAAGEIRLIVVSVAGRMMLRLQPQGGRSFPSNTVVEVNLSSEFSRSSDPYRVVLTNVDLSGLPWRDVAELVPDGQMVKVRMIAAEGNLLRGVAKEAHDAARAALGRESLPAGDVVDLRVVVDATASMLAWASSGLLGAVMDAVGGIDHVIGKDDVLDVRLTSDRSWRRVAADEAGRIAEEILKGPRLTGVLDAPPPAPDRTATLLITDLCPDDWSLGPRDCCVVLCQREAASLVGAGPRVVPVSPSWNSEAIIEDDDLTALVTGVLGFVLTDTVLKGA